MANWSRVARRIRVPLGFAFAALYIVLAKPQPWSIALGGAVAALGVWLRAAASGHVKKNEELTTTGPYAHTRNPLYVGSILIGIGFAIAGQSWWVVLAMAALFFFIYVPVVKSEEQFLRGKFANFDDYARSVPRFGWKLRAEGEAGGGFSRGLYMKHREYNAAIGTALMLVALTVKLVFFA